MALFDHVIERLGEEYSLDLFVHQNNARPHEYYKSKGFRDIELETGPNGELTGYIRMERLATSSAVPDVAISTEVSPLRIRNDMP